MKKKVLLSFGIILSTLLAANCIALGMESLPPVPSTEKTHNQVEHSKQSNSSVPTLSVSYTSTDASCSGVCNASIDLTITGGQTPYTFAWSNNESTEDLSQLCAGTYAVTITDASGGTPAGQAFDWTYDVSSSNHTILMFPNTISIDGQAIQPGDIIGVFYNSGTSVACGGYTVWTGSMNNMAAMAADGATGGFASGEAFQWKVWKQTSTGIGIVVDMTATYSSEPMFSHTGYYATNGISGLLSLTGTMPSGGAGNTITETITVVDQLGLSLSATTTDNLCYGDANGNIDLSVSGGTLPYSYAWSNNATGQDISGLAAGTFSVLVTDGNGCSAPGSYLISQPAEINLSGSVTDASTNGGADGTINLVVSGGTPNYSYAWSNNATDQNISGLMAGIYTVTLQDNKQCTATAGFTVGEPSLAPLSVSSVSTDASCYGVCDAAIDLSVSGGQTPYTFAWSNNESVEDLAQLCAGTYTVTVTDAATSAPQGSPFDWSFTVTSGNHTIMIPTGTVTIDGQALQPGDYIGVFYDASGVEACGGYVQYTGSATAMTAWSAQSGMDDGFAPGESFAWKVWRNSDQVTVDMTATYNTGPMFSHVGLYTTNGMSGIASLTGILPTGGTGNSVVETITISGQTALSLSATTTDNLCYGDASGSIDLSVSGGTLPYSYAWSNNATGQDISGLAAGTFSVLVTDGNGCSAPGSYLISQPAEINLSGSVTDASTNGGADGTINLVVSGGTPNYSYAWSNNATDQNISGLMAGIYTVTLQDNKQCTATAGFTVGEPSLAPLSVSSVSTDASCYGVCDAAIDLSVSGGQTPYTFAWSNNESVEDLAQLCAGTYTVTVTDAATSAPQGSPFDWSFTVTSGNHTIMIPTGTVTIDGQALQPGDYIGVFYDASGVEACGGYVQYTGSATAMTAWSAQSGMDDGFAPGESFAWKVWRNSDQVTVDMTATYNTGPMFSHVGLYTTNGMSGIASLTGTLPTGGTGNSVVETITISGQTALSLSATTTDNLCYGDASGSIDLSVSGGTLPYSYAWSNNATGQDISGLAAGTFSVLVTDGNGCTTLGSYLISQPAEINLSGSVTDASTNGGADGTINLVVSGGTPNYSYAWSNNATDQNISGLMAGIYTVTLQDNKQCTATAGFTVGEPSLAPLSVSSVSTDASCYGVCDAAIDLSVSGGQTPYTFAWSNNESVEDLAQLCAGTYTVTVTDAATSAPQGSPFDWSFTVTSGNHTIMIPTGTVTIDGQALQPGDYIGVFYDASGVEACGGYVQYTGSATAMTAWSAQSGMDDGFAPGESFAWKVWRNSDQVTVDMTATYNTGPMFSHVGLYTTNGMSGIASLTGTLPTGGTGNSVVETITISGQTALSLSATTTDNLCYGDASGSIDLSVSGGTLPYSYAWSNNATGQDISGLAAGTFSVLVTDGNGCTTLGSYLISQPAEINLSGSVTDASTNGGADGTINLVVSGGTPNYSYAWSNNATDQNISGLMAGIYTVTLQDNNQCTATAGFTVGEPSLAPLSVSSVSTDASCYGVCDAAIDLSVSGGQTPYTFAWSNNEGVEDLAQLCAGTYTVTVTDAATSAPQGSPFDWSFTVTSGNHTIMIPTGTVTIDGQALQPGDYIGVFYDASGVEACGGYVQYTGSATAMTAWSAQSGMDDGFAPGESFAWKVWRNSDQVTVDMMATYNTGPMFSHVGLYTTNGMSGIASLTGILPTGGTGNSVVETITISEPSEVAISASLGDVDCYNGTNGEINLSVYGGVSPYSYTWDNQQTNNDLSQLSAGTYCVTVTTNNGCGYISCYAISQPDSIEIEYTTTNISCHGFSDGSIDLQVSGGSTPYTYSWNHGATTEDLTGLSILGGLNFNQSVYFVTLEDAHGCNAGQGITLLQPEEISITSFPHHASCNGANNGSISIFTNGGTGNLNQIWSNGATTQLNNNLTAGTYCVTVSDETGCSSSLCETLTEPSEIIVTESISNTSCFGGNDGTITLSISGGSSPYSVVWENQETTQNLTGLAAGSYAVTITDDNGCTYSSSYLVSEPNELMVSGLTTNPTAYGNADGTIDISINGGNTPYTILWSNQASTEDLTALTAGTYTVNITDLYGCSISASYSPIAPMAIDLIPTHVSCNNSCDGSIDLNIQGGQMPYTVEWSNQASTEDISGLCAGTYDVTVTDSYSSTPQGQPFDWSYTITASNHSILVLPGSVFIDGQSIQEGDYIGVFYNNNGSLACAGYAIWTSAAFSTGTAISAWGAQSGMNDGLAIGETFQWKVWRASDGITIDMDAVYSSLSMFTSSGQFTPNGMSGLSSLSGTTSSAGTGNTIVQSIVISEPTAMSTSATMSDVSCFGGNDGEVDLTVSGGTTPYAFAWDNQETSEDLTGLTAGLYTVTISDANGCQVTGSYLVSEPTAISVSATTGDVGCFGGNDGEVDLTVSGGTTPYAFAWDNQETSEDLTGLTAGLYNVTISDANGCQTTESYLITEPTAISVSATTGDVSCFGGNDGEVDLTVSGGTTPYAFAWDNQETSEDLTGLTAGLYTVTISDANGCQTTGSYLITEPTAISVSATTGDVSCFGGNDGEVDLTVSGGTTPYAFAWDNQETSEDLTGLTAGLYTVTISDANGCQTTGSYLITEPTAISVSATTGDVSCFGGNDGEVDLTVSGGTTPYAFAWDNQETSEDLTGLTAGLYTVTISDANGCQTTGSYLITEPTAISVSATMGDVSCFGGNDGEVALTVSGGTTPYAFAWDNQETSEDLTGLTAGLYTVTISDANGCQVTGSYLVSEPTAISVSATTGDVGCFGGNDGEVDLTVSGGTTPYAFAWDNQETSEDLTGLTAGLYTVTISDANGCQTTGSYLITEPTAISVSATMGDVSCFGGNDGEVALTVSGGTTPYAFAWDNQETSEDLTGLTAGLYTVTISDANACQTTGSYLITEPTAISVSATMGDVSCFGGNDGEVDLTVSGGTTPYAFAWDNQETSEDLTGLTAGLYTVTISDANGCQVTGSYLVTEPTAISVSATTGDVSCFGGNDGEVDLTVSGGTTPYAFAWDNQETSEDLTGLTAGLYTVTISDANGCQVTGSYLVTEPTAISVSATTGDVSCFGGNDGEVDLTVSGGTTPYAFAWNNQETSENLTGLTAGLYTVTISDANGCQTTGSYLVTEPTAISVSATTGDVSCFGGNDGEVVLTVSGGTTPYAFAWDNQETSEDLTGITAGLYSVTISDANGCQVTGSYLVTEPTAISVSANTGDVSCFGGNDGEVDLTVSGGTTPYAFAWNNQETSEDLTGLTAGLYTVTISDANGCQTTGSYLVTEPTAISVSANTGDVSCFGGNDGEVDLTVSGGTTPYAFAWNNQETSEDLTGLTAGLYTVTISDANGCQTTESYLITEPTAISVSATTGDVSCFGGNDGEVDLTVSGGTTPYAFAWDNQETSEDLTGLTAGLYTVTISDANGCQTTGSYLITEPTAISVSATMGDVSCFGGNDGEVDLTVSGGTTPYAFVWDNQETSEDLTGMTAGLYSVTISDANGCQVTGSYLVTEPTAISVSATMGDVSCFGGNDGEVDLTVSGGTTPYAFAWDNQETSEDLTGITVGLYTVTISDANGCQTTGSYLITEPTAISVSATTGDVSCFGGNDGEVDLTVSGGTTPYAFAWDNQETSEDLTGLTAGLYTVTISDANGCQVTGSYLVTEPTAISVSATTGDVSCFGGNDGEVDLTVSGGTTPYAFAWDNQETSEDLTGLTAGLYTVTISDANACQTTGNYLVTEPTEISVNGYVSNLSTYNGADGAIDLNIVGGASPYSIVWSNTDTTEDLVGLSANTYTCTVSDANGCIGTASFVINEPLSVTISTDNVSCHGNCDGAIDLTVLGGTTPYNLTWSNQSTDEDLSNLCAGTYDVTISDASPVQAQGQAFDWDYTITSNNHSLLIMPNTVFIDGAAIQVGDYIGVFYSVNGTLACGGYTQWTTAANSSGTAISAWGAQTGMSDGFATGETFEWKVWQAADGVIFDMVADYSTDLAFSSTDQFSTNGMSGITSLTGSLTSADNSVVQTIIINEPSALAIQETISDVLCFGGNDGAIDLSVSGGTTPYTFAWSNQETSEDIDGLIPGVYIVTLSDAQGCTEVSSYSISQPSSIYTYTLVTHISCYGEQSGEINLIPTGGTSPYTFAWSNGASTEDLFNLSADSYTVTVTDNNNCTYQKTASVYEPFEIQISESITPINCGGMQNGAISVQASGGIGPYTYTWNTGESVANISGLAAGVYSLTVTDANNCTKTAEYEITEPLALSISGITSDILCFGNNEGAIDLSVTGGSTPYFYSWSNNQYTSSISGLPADNYAVTVTDINNCSSSASFVIDQADELSLSASISHIACFGDAGGAISLSVAGGTGAYSYSWSNGATTPDINNLTAGIYPVTLVDGNGCSIEESFEITEQPALSVNASISDVSVYGAANGSIGISVSGGVSPYSYVWNNQATTTQLQNLSGGVYAVTITDFVGCEIIETYFVDEPVLTAYPNWNYTQTGSTHAILIPANTSIIIDGVALVPGDFIGVFYDSLGTLACGGYTVWTGFQTQVYAQGAWAGNDGFVPGESFQWKIWRAADQQEFEAIAEYIPTPTMPNEGLFVENGLSGLLSLTAQTIAVQEIIVPTGWSIVSTYIVPDNPDIANILSAHTTSIEIVKDGFGSTYWPFYGVNLIGNMDIGEGYKLKTLNNFTLTIEGEAVVPELTPVTVPMGWSFVGYLRNTPASIVDLLSPITAHAIIVKNSYGAIYWPQYGVNLIGNMVPGEGYQLNMASAQTFTYPANTVNVQKNNSTTSQPSYFGSARNTGNSMTLGVYTNNLEPGSEIAVYGESGILVGSAIVESNFTCVTVWGNDELSVQLDGLGNGEAFSIVTFDNAKNKEAKAEELLWKEGDNKYLENKIAIVEMGSVSQSDEEVFSLEQNYPNPFVDETEIQFSIPSSSDITIRIFDARGKLVEKISRNGITKGNHVFVYKNGSLAPGTYYYQLESNMYSEMKKMIIVK